MNNPEQNKKQEAQQKKENPIRVDQRKQREIQSIVDSSQVYYIIKTHLRDKALYFKDYPKEFRTSIRNIIDEKTIELVIPPEIDLKDNITIYSVLSKFVEIDLQLFKKVSKDVYQFTIVGSNIAKTNRENFRFSIEPGDAFITNIKTSRNIIDASKYSIPTSVKVIMHQHRHLLEDIADEVHISPFDEKDSKHKLVRKTLKTYYIRDTQDMESYNPLDENFIDIHRYLGNNLTNTMQYYRKRDIVSEIISPVIYISLKQEPIPLGIIQIISKSKILEPTDVLNTAEISFQIVDKIRIANTMTINERQSVLDIGRGGAKILITDEELKNSIVHQSGFSFDLFFRMQAPITLYADIRSTTKNDKGDLIVGVDFSGHSSRKDELRRLVEILKHFEKSNMGQLN